MSLISLEASRLVAGARDRTASLGVAVLVFVSLLAVDARALDDNAVLRLTLPGALKFENPRKDRHVDWADVQALEVELARRGGAWDAAAWGFLSRVPGQEHLGKVTKAEAVGDGWRFEIDMVINNNRNRPLMIGGSATLTIELTKQGDGYAGTFTASTKNNNNPQTYRTLEDAWGWGYEPGVRGWQQDLVANQLNTFLIDGRTQGKASAVVGPLRLKTRFADFNFAPNEHPRLLFRKDDIPRIRERMQTPQGQAIIEQLETLLGRAHDHGFGYRYPQATHSMGPNWAVGHGLLYQLTGDKKHADIAKAWCTGQLFGPYYYGGGWLHAYTLQGVAVAYDLCYDAWDDDFRNMVYAFLEKNIRDLAQRGDGKDLLNTNRYFTFANDQGEFRVSSVDSLKHVKFRAGAATAALALMNDAPAAFKPTPLEEVRVIEPADDYEPWFGVPVVPFTDDMMPRHWITNGPFRHGTTDEIVKQWGGWEKLRPEPGDTVEVDGIKVDWRRYDPAGQYSERPKIYMRDCGRFWSSSTGKGYPPGKALIAKWREQAGRKVGYQYILYTVIDNDAERVVQAMPNWKSHAAGCRMWINGQRVRDGDLVRIKPGLYTLAVDVRPTGGYAQQSPRLRAYTQADYDRDIERYNRATEGFAGGDVFTNEMHRNYMILMRSILRYMDQEVGPDGWVHPHTLETVLPLLTMHLNASGDNLAADTGLQHLLGVALRQRGHARARDYDYMVSQSAALMPDDSLPIARWYLDRFGVGLARPLDALVAITTHPLGVAPVDPATRYERAHYFASHGKLTFNTGFNGGEDFLVRLNATAGPNASSFGFGMLNIHGANHAWVPPVGEGMADVHAASTLAVRGFHPVGRGALVHHATQPDGSGSATVRHTKFLNGLRTQKGDVYLGKKDPKIALQRAVVVDYVGAGDDNDVVIITADQYDKVGTMEKQTRLCLGRTEVITDPKDKRSPGVRFFKPDQGQGFDLTLGADKQRNARPATMRVTYLSTRELHVVPRKYGDPGKSVRVDVTADRVLSKKEQLEKERIREMSGKADAKDGGAGSALGTGDNDLDNLFGEIDKDLKAETHKEERLKKPAVIFTVITINRTGKRHPGVKVVYDDGGATLTVGEKTYRYDGKVLAAQ